ncbi:MFS transporter [Paenibacillus sp. 481]|nr:MFS transporter [Paenibacillus sp. 481]
MFMIFTPAALFSSFFPLYYKDIGYTDAMYGMQNAILPIIGMVANYLFGYISDKFGSMKPMLISMYVLLMGVLYFIFQTSDPWIVMGLVFLFQFLWIPAMMLTDSMAMLAARRLGDSYAVIRGFGAAGFAVAALLIGWLLDALPGNSSMGWIAIALVGLTCCALLPIRDPRRQSVDDRKGSTGTSAATDATEPTDATVASDPKGAQREPVQMRELWKYVLTKRFILFAFIMLIYQMTFVFNDQYFSFLIREVNGTAFDIGLGWMLPAAIEVGVFLYLGRSNKRFKPLPMLAISAVIMAVRAFVIGMTDSLPIILFMQAVQGVAIAIFFVYLAEYMMELIPDRFRVSGQATLSVVLSIGATMTGSLIGAYIYNQWGLKMLFYAMGVLLIVTVVGFFIAERQEKKRRAQASISESN